ncbi:MAG TPA: Rrf2 family transcriptional regulator [Sphingobacterium sp.]|nr:Rrf2 family transcriptional regulator [Sphingobacterium sp.]
MLSKTCEYALRAMIYIAKRSKDGAMVNIKEISENIDSPELFAAKILQDLSRRGFLQSSKGRYGGFYISDKEAERSLADIVRAIDGDKMFTGCGLGLEFCSEANPCPIHDEYKAAREELYNIYGKTTLSQFRTSLCDEKVLLKRE